MKNKVHIPLWVILASLLPFTVGAQNQAWWEPIAPVIGQPFTIYYDDIAGTLPNGSTQCWLHWGVVNAQGNWSAPPQSCWPAGSQLSPDGYACQSPMARGTDNYWFVAIDPDTTVGQIEFVFTDMANHWDNNGNQNWSITFISGAIASWWYPENPLPGDLLTIFYNAIPGTLPNNAVNVKLHWGMNETGAGNWIEPPASMWPPQTIPWGDGHAVQSPMQSLGNGIWSIEIQSNDTTYTLHYVVTNGTNWDNNGGANWNIFLEEPPTPIYTYQTFYYDTRSAFATYGVEEIYNIKVAGTFNNWSTTANPLTGPDDNGAYSAELHIPVGTTNYKFVINGNIWVQDPDNPLTDGSSYMNSQLVATPDSLPYFTQVSPVENMIYIGTTIVNVSATVRPSDLGPGILGIPTLAINGYPSSVNYDPSTGLMTSSITLPSLGIYNMVFSAGDSIGNIGGYEQNIWRMGLAGFLTVLDTYYDDNGTGSYSYPEGQDDAADFLQIMILDNGIDSILFQLDMANITDATRVLFQICTDIVGMYYEPPLFDIEIATPEWNGSGVQICLADPNSPNFEPEIHNRLIIARAPVEFGIPLQVSTDGNTFTFLIAVSDLEAVMGSYNREWYYGAWSFLEGPPGTFGHSWEVDAEHGGVAGIQDPDVFDIMFVDNRELQKRMLSNYSLNRTCTMDNTGRGFRAILPDEIGPNIGNSGPVLSILTQGAPTIDSTQTIVGTVETTSPITVTLHRQVNGNVSNYTIPAVSDTFEWNLILLEGANTIWASAVANGDTGVSPATIFELEVNHSPNPVIEVSFANDIFTLDATSSSDPDNQALFYLWVEDENNPDIINLSNPTSATVSFPCPDIMGEYYFNLYATDPDSNVSYARSFVTIYPDSVHIFDENESAQWVQNALVYEIFVRSYSPSHQLSAITEDMQRIHNWGYNAIWLMPIFPGPSDHGYAITDYYGIEEDYGTPEDFAELVESAHSYGIKVILDLVINHTSIEHPFMQDAMDFDIYSHYYDYYDRDANGNYTYYYDWLSLPNLNYDNPEVWDYFIEVSKYWVEEFDVDGYRCDVAWGPQTRNPAFWVEWREELKKIKPEIFLLAEATCTDFTYFDHRFDSAMDWNLHHEAPTNFSNMFPGPPNLNQLHDAITNYGYPYPQYHYPFRFLENHDEERYIAYNTANQTKLAATLLLTIPGIPMIYAGQEIGTTTQRGQITWGSDPYDVADHYWKLTHIRTMFPALRTAGIQRLNNTQYSTVYSFGRYQTGAVPVISVMNFTSWSQVVTITVPVTEWGIEPTQTYCLNEMLGNTHAWLTGAQLTTITTSLGNLQSLVYVISDSVITLEVEAISSPTTYTYRLSQNYPNPFNQECEFNFELPFNSKVNITIYNILGQKVKTLSDDFWTVGIHSIKWDGRNESGDALSSGMYFYRMQAGDFLKTQKMVLLR